MPVRGKVMNGKVVLANPKSLPNGTEVEVRPVKKKRTTRKTPKTARKPRSLADILRPVIGMVTDLPPDASVNSDFCALLR